jgi:hypothetical protein
VNRLSIGNPVPHSVGRDIHPTLSLHYFRWPTVERFPNGRIWISSPTRKRPTPVIHNPPSKTLPGPTGFSDRGGWTFCWFPPEEEIPGRLSRSHETTTGNLKNTSLRSELTAGVHRRRRRVEVRVPDRDVIWKDDQFTNEYRGNSKAP